MIVKRVVPNIEYSKPSEAKAFYQQLLGLDMVMDQEWIITLASPNPTNPQISFASQGGSGTDVPTISIEVDDVDQAYQRARKIGADIVYELTDEDWGVRRFYVRDPGGHILNILAHN